MYGNRIGNYQKNDIVTADPKRLVIICYGALIANLKLAKSSMLEKSYETKTKAITKSNEIIIVLMEGLDFEKGGAISINLDAIYNYMLRRILHADVNLDIEALDEIIGIAEELGDSWKQIFGKKQQANGDYHIPATPDAIPRRAESVA